MRYAMYPESHAAHEAYNPYAVPIDREPFPAPEVTSRDPRPLDFLTPAAVLKLRSEAEEWGWTVEQQYARGHGQHSTTGRPLAMLHTVGLKFNRHPRTDAHACAVYRSPVARPAWTWISVFRLGRDSIIRLDNVTALRDWLKGWSEG